MEAIVCILFGDVGGVTENMMGSQLALLRKALRVYAEQNRSHGMCTKDICVRGCRVEAYLPNNKKGRRKRLQIGIRASSESWMGKVARNDRTSSW